MVSRRAAIAISLVAAACQFSATGLAPSSSDGPRAQPDGPRLDTSSSGSDGSGGSDGSNGSDGSGGSGSNHIEFIQGSNSSSGNTTTATITLGAAEQAGDFTVLVVAWANTAQVLTVVDTGGNSYTPVTSGAASASANGHTVSLQTFYRTNVAAAQPTITVSFNSGAATPELRVAEYSGVATSNPVDGNPAIAEANTSSLDTGTINTTTAHDLLFAPEVSADMVIQTDPSYTSRASLHVDGDIVEDREVFVTGTYNATANLSQGAAWAMMLIGFKGAD